MRKWAAVMSGVVALAGCAGGSGTGLEKYLNIPGNYASVHERMVNQIKTCQIVSDGYQMKQSIQPNEGYGEIRVFFGQNGPDAYYIRTTGSGNSTEALIRVSTAMGNENKMSWLDYWMRGGTKCSTSMALEQAPT